LSAASDVAATSVFAQHRDDRGFAEEIDALRWGILGQARDLDRLHCKEAFERWMQGLDIFSECFVHCMGPESDVAAR